MRPIDGGVLWVATSTGERGTRVPSEEGMTPIYQSLGTKEEKRA